MSDRLGSDGIKLDSNIELGFYFRTPLKNEKNIRDAGVKVIDSTKGGGFRFHTKELDALNTEYRDLLQSYETCQAHLTKLVVSTCGLFYYEHWTEMLSWLQPATFLPCKTSRRRLGCWTC